MKLSIGDKEKRILEILQENCRLTVKEIARKIDSPITTIYSKLKKLEKKGYIKKYTAIINEKKLGLTTTAYILLSFSYETKNGRKLDQREVARRIARIPEVQEAHIVTGDWDIILKVRVKDVDDLGKFIIDKLRRIEGVEKTLTSVVLETVKETTKIPIRGLYAKEEK